MELKTLRPARPAAAIRAPFPCAGCGLCESCLETFLDDAATPRSGASASARLRIRRGESLLRVGAPFDSLFVVRSGFFKSNVVVEDGRDQVMGFHMAGEILGMDAMGTGSHSADVTALEDSEVCAIPGARLHEPAMLLQLQRLMSRELVRGQALMLVLGTLRAEERLASFLLGLSQRFLARGYSPNDFHLRMTREEIGSYIGLSLETVSRLFSRFQGEHFIAVNQKHVRILDVEGLRGVARGVIA